MCSAAPPRKPVRPQCPLRSQCDRRAVAHAAPATKWATSQALKAFQSRHRWSESTSPSRTARSRALASQQQTRSDPSVPRSIRHSRRLAESARSMHERASLSPLASDTNDRVGGLPRPLTKPRHVQTVAATAEELAVSGAESATRVSTASRIASVTENARTAISRCEGLHRHPAICDVGEPYSTVAVRNQFAGPCHYRAARAG